MNKLHTLAASLLVAGTVGAVSPVSAAPLGQAPPVQAPPVQERTTERSGERTGGAGCTQTASGAGGTTSGAPQTTTDPQSSSALLVGVVAAAVQNVSALDNVQNALTNTLSGANVELVCLNDVLNENDIRLLQDILNESPILNDNLNNSLNNNEVLKNVLNSNNIAANVEVVSVRLLSGGTSQPQTSQPTASVSRQSPAVFLMREVQPQG
jgi:hypothetical protein